MSPAKYTDGRSPITNPSGSARGPRTGNRVAEWSARTASTRSPRIAVRSPLLQLLDLEPGSAQQFARTPGRHEQWRTVETAERRDVEVIVMQVRDEDGVEVPRHFRRRAVATEMSDSAAKDRVGEEAHATEL